MLDIFYFVKEEPKHPSRGFVFCHVLSVVCALCLSFFIYLNLTLQLLFNPDYIFDPESFESHPDVFVTLTSLTERNPGSSLSLRYLRLQLCFVRFPLFLKHMRRKVVFIFMFL